MENKNKPTKESFTIKEASQLSGLPESTLRYYESIGLIQSIQRDPSSKHRMYSQDDMNSILAVTCLNAMGMSIEDIRQYLDSFNKGGSQSAKEQLALLETYKQRFADEAKLMKLRQKYVDIKMGYWKAVISGDKKIGDKMVEASMKVSEELLTIQNKNRIKK